ncbi:MULTISPECIES: phosphotransferase [Nocardiopsis]|uniref:Aminoglycoside phosphotransferase n=1 Tax=Nocardiopsis dassonvillei (strain ATCC 23218 / DSM 43111 / CIP 107115 / JCM 7437 / KCTC 9190 / NBRC 14626 / NCTC 10488 / NRRL B-5397 / IMRU 509) TaxID=446468 RepID=D7B794_NOCDD|nr:MULTISPECIES: phosphotransferase [Nocardiopsis]ADH67466.1 aminoglycoside phosphotransferase [Nocardiopsis dassonvillei subsp. dassonvillei DSM 43111]APC35667.1 aminoglycoside phosphotransferase [Nocardiopsis dassonvillei]NKY80836.1 phosphotransferase [Nocardiopsis dassonvillei]VEI87687.1 Phosphotransferase enzyme family [Nocardiopsis dassonvillei]
MTHPTDTDSGTDNRGKRLAGGMMTTVFRYGGHVVRTATPAAPAIHAHLRALGESGFRGAPVPLRLRDDGREELTFVEGDVALPPFPDWAFTEHTLRSCAELLRLYHDAAARVPVDASAAWNTGSTGMADPEGGPILCHNDPCLENIVFRRGRATALIDFDLAAPGRPVWDVAALAYYLVPALDPVSAAGTPHEGSDVAHRLRLLADAYGLSPEDRRALPGTVEEYTAVARVFVAERVENGDGLFARDLERTGGWERWDRRQAWLADQRAVFVGALVS